MNFLSSSKAPKEIFSRLAEREKSPLPKANISMTFNFKKRLNAFAQWALGVQQSPLVRETIGTIACIGIIAYACGSASRYSLYRQKNKLINYFTQNHDL